MKVIVCVEDDMGIMFNKRRVSRDEKVIEKIIEIADGKRIWMSQYSYPLFEKTNSQNVNADDLFLENALKDEYCFVEGNSLSKYKDKIDRIILFRWNRNYPSDVKLDISLTDWKLDNCEEFSGNSHECITMEVYSK